MKNNGAGETIERAIDETFSKQSRLNSGTNTSAFLRSVMRWVQKANLTEPEYGHRDRDAWLLEFGQREPHLAGVVSSVVSIDANRSWYLTGGRNQVRRYTDVLHNFDDGDGWRESIGVSSNAFWSTDLGSPTELGRDGIGGPLRALYTVDPTLCELTGNRGYPLKFRDAAGAQFWSKDDFFRVASMPNVRNKFNGLGFCAVSRCLELAKLMVAVYQHDNEMLLARAPRGLLLLQGIDEEQWTTALQGRDAELTGMGREFFDLIMVLASSGMQEVDAKLVALSQLPANFDIQVTTNLLMQAFALCFGYDIREFWAVSSGALGTATETETMHRKSGGKGALDFVHKFQERLQGELPDTLEFAFEERDADGELRDAELAIKQAEGIIMMYEAGRKDGDPLIDRREARILLADKGLIKPEWSEAQEEAISTDTQEARSKRFKEQLLESAVVRRACERYEDEAIIRYTWPTERTIMIWESGKAALHRVSYPAANVTSVPVRYSDDGTGAWIETGRNSISPVDPNALRK